MNESLGRLLSWQVQTGRLQLIAENAVLTLTWYTASTIRVRVNKTPVPERPPYAVIQEPDPEINPEPAETAENITFSTAELRVEISKTPIRIRFYKPGVDGQPDQLLNADHEAFGISWLGTQVTNYKALQEGERFVGMGEKPGALDRKGHAMTHWNTDAFAYAPDEDLIYVSVPFYVGILPGNTYGILLNNTHKSLFNFGASNNRFTSFSAEDGALDYFFIAGGEMPDTVIRAYSQLTGLPPHPPKWSLGYQQCRYSYFPDSEVLRIAQTFREKEIPADVIYLDIQYMDAFKVFTFDQERFPDPAALVGQLQQIGFNVVVILDPGIKVEPGYTQYESGKNSGHFVKYPDGVDYEAEVWPGWSSFPDFTRPETRSWWAEQIKVYTELGIKGFWNDMNEPAVWGKHVPDLLEFDFEGAGATHREAHNVYGMQMTRASYEGALKHLPDNRPFLLTRAGFAGIQRYSAVWTGDNVASEDHLFAGIKLLLSMGLSGIPFAGNDIAGFIGDANAGLYLRWLQTGVFTPFFRGHSMINSNAAEPWAYGEEAMYIARDYIRLRYQLMPYLYTAAWQASQDGLPIMRALMLEIPREPKAYDPHFEHQYFFGHELMIVPAGVEERIRKIYLPEGEWYDFFDDTRYQGGQEIYFETPLHKLPIFVRGAGMVFAESVRASTNHPQGESLHLHLYQGKASRSTLFYDDDGSSFKWQQGEFCKIECQYSGSEGKLTLRPDPAGNHKPGYEKLRIWLHGFAQIPGQLKVNGETISVQHEDFSWMGDIPSFDPFKGDTKKAVMHNLPYLELPMGSGAFEVELVS